MEFLLTSLEAAEKDATFTPIRHAIAAGISNLMKWYRKLDSCHVYTVSNILDLSIKLAYIKKNWGPQFVLHIKTLLETIFDKYNQAAEATEVIALSLKPGATEYLDAKREECKEGLVEWWGHNSACYPILSRIAQDYLAIQGSSVASERAFSSGRLTGTYLRNRLNTDTFEALQIVKSTFRNGILRTSDEAAAASWHMAAEWDFGGLVDMEDSSDPV